jgi:hypothetical protein
MGSPKSRCFSERRTLTAFKDKQLNTFKNIVAKIVKTIVL